MTDEILVDSNILVYAFDPSVPRKHAEAIEALNRLMASGRGRISCQVLGEFFRVVTERIRPPLNPPEAYRQVARLVRTWPIFPTTPLVVLEAARGVRDHRLSYWDAQIWASARLHQVPIVLSEDFAHGRTLDGVRFVNPFVVAFDWTMLGL